MSEPDVPITGHMPEPRQQQEEGGWLWPIIRLLVLVGITVGVCYYFMSGPSEEERKKTEEIVAQKAVDAERAKVAAASKKIAEALDVDKKAPRPPPKAPAAKALKPTATMATLKVPPKKEPAEGKGTPVAKTTEDITFEMFKSLQWREGASKEHGHILYPEEPIVGEDFGEKSTHYLAPLFLKHYRLEPVLKAKSGRTAWALVPIKNSLTPPKEILGMYKSK